MRGGLSIIIHLKMQPLKFIDAINEEYKELSTEYMEKL